MARGKGIRRKAIKKSSKHLPRMCARNMKKWRLEQYNNSKDISIENLSSDNSSQSK